MSSGAPTKGGIQRLKGITVNLLNTTVANAPSASAAGAATLIYVSNGNAGQPCIACSDGTNWKIVALGATISAT